jgi:alcohol dehydrogenase class IV
MLLPEFLQLHERLIGKGRDGLALLQKAHAKILSIVGFSDMPSFISAYYELMRNVGFPTFKELNCQEHFNGKLILDSVNMERLSNHPLNLRREDLESIFLR